MRPKFDIAFDYTMHNEGGAKFTNDPKDSGGPTKYGVTLKTYAAYVQRPVEVSEIQDLTEEKAKQFYFDTFWKPLQCEGLAMTSVAVAVFDTAILYGPKFAAKAAQAVANRKGNSLKLDGVLGDKSREAINKISGPDFLISYFASIMERVELVVAANPKNERFRNGWRNRANRLLSLTKPLTEDKIV